MDALIIMGAKMPKNCFRCFASKWYNFGGQVAGFRCGAMPRSNKIITNIEGRSGRRADCPLNLLYVQSTAALETQQGGNA